MGILRLTHMKPLLPMSLTRVSFAVAALLLCGLNALPAAAQEAVGNGRRTPFKDTGVIVHSEEDLLKDKSKPKVAILEFEDLECPACAHAAPIVKTAIEHYHIAFLRHDFLIQGHAWSRQAAIIARYLQDKVSPDQAEMYRRDVFANQNSIAGPDDLSSFTQRWFAAHHIAQPFNMDPNGLFAAEVQADVTLGDRLGLIQTPTIVVVGPKGWVEVTDSSQLYTAIDQVLAQVPASSTATHNNLKKPVSAQR